MNNLKIVNEVLSSFNINPLENYYLLLALIVFSVLYFLFLLYLKNLRKYYSSGKPVCLPSNIDVFAFLVFYKREVKPLLQLPKLEHINFLF